jgi:hypothetical protein
MRFLVVRRAPYAFEPSDGRQFSSGLVAEARPLATTSDLNVAQLAAMLWANWIGDYAFVYDTNLGKYVGTFVPGQQPQNVQIGTAFTDSDGSRASALRPA